jgi:hypothetical protein
MKKTKQLTKYLSFGIPVLVCKHRAQIYDTVGKVLSLLNGKPLSNDDFGVFLPDSYQDYTF